ncbi:hypothetical protein ACRYKS_26605 [Escherichia coli]|uniref:Uncharacterized protein n=2 Tax=Caudoviricetes TaxID=2731619 RepID=A0A1C3S6V2_9CAUD|nr:hypothetical protein [Escherichia coli]QAY00636.1 hypothetical protein Ecwhy1_361 [Escherichia phage Ecwhy_1]SCA80289.1 hypothetical protein PSLUR01_00312 [Escherichia phage vB_Eco_slurp01]EGE5776665.1 hypothetical protein [Escherichia coli]ELW0836590.1 hypothetical protein [Escherichia coli]VVY10810.1 Uncharacterised protein [Escherichia coli]
MDTKFKLIFKTEPYIPYTGERFIPPGAVEIEHPDGTKLYLSPCSYERAVEMLIMNSKHCSNKYISYLYNEHILEFNDENMFMLAINDFNNWHESLTI